MVWEKYHFGINLWHQGYGTDQHLQHRPVRTLLKSTAFSNTDKVRTEIVIFHFGEAHSIGWQE